MGKRSRKEPEASINKDSAHVKPWNNNAVDSSLAALFASSAGPVEAPPKSRYAELPPAREDSQDRSEVEDEGVVGLAEEELSSVEGDLEDADLGDLSDRDDSSEEDIQAGSLHSTQRPERKRKRNIKEDDLEDKYMQKLADEEEKEEAARKAERQLKRQKVAAGAEHGTSNNEDAEERADGNSEAETPGHSTSFDVPLHETLAADGETTDLEKSTRTVFLANVSTTAISSKSDHKILLKHLSSFLADLEPPSEVKPAHKLESLRFRSTPFASPHLPKKASFAKKDIRQATTKSTNAYAVYSSAFAAREATKRLNGTIVLKRHLRVDGVAHPAKTDHKRCVFVGNLGFVDDESMLEAGENERKRSKVPSDIEEGLWRQFGKAGKVESVRVIRDEKTRVGKGFAYVQFVDANAVEAALLFNEKKYPPMLPRILRVVRAKPPKSTALAVAAAKGNRKQSTKSIGKAAVYNPKVSSEASSLQGRASKLLGKAGASKIKSTAGAATGGGAKSMEEVKKTPETIIFEGHRASSAAGKPNDLKMGKKRGGGKPKTKGARRAAAWKKSGGRA